MRLKEITVSGFRGFNKKQTINLDSNLILIKGSNGSGKSSLVEAIEWLFFDEIARRKKSLCKSEYSGEFLRNLHCDEDQEAFVELIVNEKNKDLILKKVLLSPEKKEFYINGVSFDDFSSLGINFSEVYKPLLSQVEVKHYVETDPKDRYEETNEILGLGILNELRSDLQTVQNGKKTENTFQTYRRNYIALERDLSELNLRKLWTGMSDRPFSAKAFENLLVKTITETYSFGPKCIDELGVALDNEFKRLAQESDSSDITELAPLQSLLAINSASCLVIETRQIFSLISQLKPTNAELGRFLETGRGLIEENKCPFCQEQTITAEKESQIEARIKLTKESQILLSNIADKVTRIQQSRDSFNFQSIASINTIAIDKIRTKITQKSEYSNELKQITSLQESGSKLEHAISKFNSTLLNLFDNAKNISMGKMLFDELIFASIISEAEHLAKQIDMGIARLREDTQILMSSIVAKAPSLSSHEKQDLKKYFLFKKILDRLSEIKYVGYYENELANLSNLILDIENFEKNKSANQMTKLNDTIKTFYQKMNPQEKTQFSEISSKGKNRKIQIKAVSHGKDMNPVSCFSEAHMNCLCLSIYFSQRVLDNPYWDFVVLDDPVQSMDEDHSKNLIRLLDEVHTSKQVIVASHNAHFCQDFRDLFYGRDIYFYEFFGNEVTGPRIELKQAPFETYLLSAKKFCNGNSEERATAGNNLRKAIERFTADLLVARGLWTYNKAYTASLDEHLQKIEISKVLPIKDIAEIKGMLRVCNSACHEPPERDVMPAELIDGIRVLSTIYETYLKVA